MGPSVMGLCMMITCVTVLYNRCDGHCSRYSPDTNTSLTTAIVAKAVLVWLGASYHCYVGLDTSGNYQDPLRKVGSRVGR